MGIPGRPAQGITRPRE